MKVICRMNLTSNLMYVVFGLEVWKFNDFLFLFLIPLLLPTISKFMEIGYDG